MFFHPYINARRASRLNGCWRVTWLGGLTGPIMPLSASERQRGWVLGRGAMEIWVMWQGRQEGCSESVHDSKRDLGPCACCTRCLTGLHVFVICLGKS